MNKEQFFDKVWDITNNISYAPLFTQTMTAITYTKVFVPGQFTAGVPGKHLTVHFNRHTPEHPGTISKAVRQKMFHHYEVHGLFDRCFTPDQAAEIKKTQQLPYLYDFRYAVPLDCGGTAVSRNIVLMCNHAGGILGQRLWYPIREKMSQILASNSEFREVSLQIPQVPAVVHIEDVVHFCESNEAEERRILKRRDVLSRDSHVHADRESKRIVIRVSGHPFQWASSVCVQMQSPIPGARQAFYADVFLKRKIRRRDAALLAGLSPEERVKMSMTGIYPKRMHLEMHHIVPLEFGGQNELANVCLIHPDTHRRFNDTVEYPLRQFFTKNPDLCQPYYNGIPVFLEVPMPLLSYRTPRADLTEIQRLKTNHTKYERRKVRRSEKTNLSLLIRNGHLDKEYEHS